MASIVCLAVLLGLHATNQFDSDEGMVLNGAWNLFNGRALYTDVFEFIAPGSYYLVFAAWKLFGPHFWAAKLAGIVAVAAGALGVYCTTRVVLAQEQTAAPHWISFLGPVVFCVISGYWPAINHNTFNIAVVIWSASFLARSIVRKSLRDACVAGALSGMAILFLQHRGLVLAGSSMLFLGYVFMRDRDASSLRHFAGFALCALVPAAAMLLFWPASLLLEDLIRFPATRYLAINRIDSSLFWLTAGALILMAWLLRGSASGAVRFLLFLQLTLFLTALQRPDLSHITVTLFPVLSLLPIAVARASEGALPRKLMLSWVGVTLLVLLFPLIVYLPALCASRFANRPEQLAIDFIKRNCVASPYLYAGPYEPGLYFETGKLSATRYSVLLTTFNTSEEFLRAREDFEANRPLCVVINHAKVEKFNYRQDNILERYIASRYRLAYQAGPVQVLLASSWPVKSAN